MYSASMLTAQLKVLIQNPFKVSPEKLMSASSVFAALERSEIERLAQAHPMDEVLLALEHAKALQGSWTDPAKSGSLAGRALSPERRQQFARTALSSARCVQHLSLLHGTSVAMQRVRQDVWAACFGVSLVHGAFLNRVVRGHDVLIGGETGTGKELVARALALGTPSAAAKGEGPFAEINAAAVPDTLVESELFGHTKGAFTGASEARLGLVRTAHGGALFLDEVGDLPLSAQAKLLRVIETDLVQPVGSDKPYQVDVRFLAATHRDLLARVQEGSFRADLYQRLAGVVIRVPALRERPEDIVEIGERFVENSLSGVDQVDRGPVLRWLRSPEARRHSWPGNVRELRNVLRNLILGLPSGLSGTSEPAHRSTAHIPARIRDGEATLHEVEGWYMTEVMKRTDGNMAAAARILGIDRTTLKRKL